ncbi:MAG: hypothetical protein LBC30_03230 [Puniceicoccales bacterium]|jgi:hypothetical protein|nr:hypothetical protein [Puniceicoccales bacterium]
MISPLIDMKNSSKKNKCLQDARPNFRRNLSKKIRKFLTAAKSFTKNALKTKSSKIIGASKTISQYARNVATLLSAKTAQTYGAAKGKAGKIAEKFKQGRTRLASAISNFRKQFSKTISQYARNVATLLSAKTAQMYGAAKGKAGKIVKNFRYAQTASVSAMSKFRKQFLKTISQFTYLLKFAFVVSLQVTRVGVMLTINLACLLIINGASAVQSCLTKSRSFVKSGNQKLINALKFLVSASIFTSEMVCGGVLFLCLSMKNIIRKAYSSTLVSIRTLFQFVKKLTNITVKIIAYPFISIHTFLKKFANALRTTCISCAVSLKSSISNVRVLLKAWFSSLKAQFSYGNALAVLQKPAVVLPLIFTIVAFVGLRIYDSQMSKIKYARAAFAVKHEKDLLRQKRYVLHSYENENIASKHRGSKKDRAIAQASPSRSNSYTDLQKAVDSFFHNHRVSEVMCDKNSCKIKVDDRIIDGKGPIADNSTIFISEANGDHIVFADASGNRYVKSIDSLFDQ